MGRLLKFFPECEECLLNGARRMMKLATDDVRIHLDIMDELLKAVPSGATNRFTLDVARQIQGIVEEAAGVKDPFRQYKKQTNQMALEIVSEMKEWIELSADPLFMAVKLAIAGNIIDFVASPEFDLNCAVEQSLQCEPERFDYPLFLDRVESAQSILYLGDNAGEIVFDKLLIEQILRLGKKITFAVRSAPILNDATMEDAREVKLDQIVDVISTGSTLPGVVLDDCSPEFRSRFDEADLIISKGQGNFEGLCGEERPVFFLLKAKCVPIAQELNVQVGAIVLQASQDYSWNLKNKKVAGVKGGKK